MIPIPTALLPQTIRYEAATSARHGNSYDAPVTVSHVRVKPSMTMQTDRQVQKPTYSYLIFIDAVNSMPHIQPKYNDRITYTDLSGQDISMRVQKVNEMWAFNQLHHYEVLCS